MDFYVFIGSKLQALRNTFKKHMCVFVHFFHHLFLGRNIEKVLLVFFSC